MCCDNWGMLLFYDWSDYSLTLCSVSHSICSSCCCDGRLPTPLPAFEAGNSIAIYVSPDLPKMKGTISQTSFPGSGSGGRQEILQHLAYLGIIINHCTSPFGFGGRPFSPPQKKARPEDILPPMASFSTASCFWRFTACNSWGIHNNRWCLVSEIIHFWGWSTVDGSWPKPRSLVSKSPVSSHVCPTWRWSDRSSSSEFRSLFRSSCSAWGDARPRPTAKH